MSQKAAESIESTRGGTNRSALILYGSETGNAQDVAHEIARLTERLHFDAVVLDLDSVELSHLREYTVTIIAISTTGQGEFPQNARLFWRSLLSSRLKPGILRRMVFTSFGLGDSSYPKYNIAHRMLHGRLTQLGARTFCARAEGNEQHPEGHSAALREWILELNKSLLGTFPLPLNTSILPETAFIEPKWKLSLVLSRGEQADELSSSLAKLSTASGPDSSLIPARDSIRAEITGNDRITPPDHFQDVRVLDLRLAKQVSYGPGAVAVIYPKNFPADVEDFIQCQGWSAVADELVSLRQVSMNSSMPFPSPLSNIALEATTLRELLTNYLDILSIPRRSFFSSLAHFTRSETEDEQYHKERILELANPELIDELWDYTTRPRRTILEIMPDFPSVKIPWQYACTVLPIMRGRQFSIASGGKLRIMSDGTTRVQLLIAIANPPNPIIKYRRRHGVCTRYIAQLQAGSFVNVGLQEGYLGVTPTDYASPTIMISPGTGVAPMRNLIYDRLQAAAENAFEHAGKPLDGCVLFFGCRNSHADFFFEHDWDDLASQGLRTFVATSRQSDAPRKYVQDMLREQGQTVFDLVHNQCGRIFVCGSSGNMPKGVRQALIDIIAQVGGLSPADAELYVENLEKAGRYKQETW